MARINAQIIAQTLKLVVANFFVADQKWKAINGVEKKWKNAFLAFLVILLEFNSKSIFNLSSIAAHMEKMVWFSYQLKSKQEKRIGCGVNVFLLGQDLIKMCNWKDFLHEKTIYFLQFSLSSFVQGVAVGTYPSSSFFIPQSVNKTQHLSQDQLFLPVVRLSQKV